MLLLDRVVDFDATKGAITCSASIGEDHPFLENGEVDILVCVGFVAQSVAAYAGYSDHLAGHDAKIGLLVSCREATFDAPSLVVGDELEVTATHRSRICLVVSTDTYNAPADVSRRSKLG